MRQSLPEDISLHLLQGAASWLGCLRGCLTSILEEAKGESEGMERRLQEAGEHSLKDEDKRSSELRDKTDWTMSMATRYTCNYSMQ